MKNCKPVGLKVHHGKLSRGEIPVLYGALQGSTINALVAFMMEKVGGTARCKRSEER